MQPVKLKTVVQTLTAEHRTLEAKLKTIDAALRALRTLDGAPKSRRMPAAARKRIAAAQRLRWKKFRAAKSKKS
jgi:hypothetical protein